MTDTNQDAEAAGSSVDTDSSQEVSGDSEANGQRPGSRAPHKDLRTPVGDASRERATDRVGGGTRRRFLAAVSAASAATLAGCPGSSDSDQTTGPAPDGADTQSPPSGDSGTTTAESGETGTETETETDTSTPQPMNGVRLPSDSLAELQLGVVGFDAVTLPDEGGS